MKRSGMCFLIQAGMTGKREGTVFRTFAGTYYWNRSANPVIKGELRQLFFDSF